MTAEITTQEVKTNDFKEVANKLILESNRKDTGKIYPSIYPLWEVKMIKMPKQL